MPWLPRIDLAKLRDDEAVKSHFKEALKHLYPFFWGDIDVDAPVEYSKVNMWRHVMEERGTHRNIPGWVMAEVEVNSVVSSIGYKLFTAKSWESHFLGGCLVGSSILLRSSFIFFGWFPLQASLIAQQFLGLTERTSRQLAWSSKLCAHPFDIYLSIYKIQLQIIPLSWLHIPNSLLLWKSLKLQVWSDDWIHTSAIPRTTEAAIIIYVWCKIGGANPQTELFWWDGSSWILDGSSKLWCFEWNGIL